MKDRLKREFFAVNRGHFYLSNVREVNPIVESFKEWRVSAGNNQATMLARAEAHSQVARGWLCSNA